MPTKKRIKSMLNGYTMKRTKPEIVDAIQYYANECELYRLIDFERSCRNVAFVKLLFWAAGCENDISEQHARDLCVGSK